MSSSFPIAIADCNRLKKVAPVCLRNASPLRIAINSLRKVLAFSSSVSNSFIIIRCGMPSIALETITLPGFLQSTYRCSVSRGTGLSSVIKKRVPIAIPSAPHDSAANRPRPSLNPPAPTTGTLPPTASTTCDSSSVVGIGPVWPPPSPP